MKATTIKARWAAKLLRSNSFAVVTDTESAIFSEHTDANNFQNYITAHQQLGALARFQTALNKTVRDFEKQMNTRFGGPEQKATHRGRKITVKTK